MKQNSSGLITTSIILLLAILLIPSCATKHSEEFVEVNVDNRFSMKLPSYMEKADNLREDAVLQYSSRYRNTYVVVFEDKIKSTEKDFRTYKNDAVKVLTQYLDNPVITDSTAITINAIPGYETEVFGKIGEDLIYYDLLVLETAESYYQVCTWTRGPERLERYGKDLKAILYSFDLPESAKPVPAP